MRLFLPLSFPGILAVRLFFAVLVCFLCLGGAARAELSRAYINELKLYTVGDERGRDKPRPIDDPDFVRMTDAGLYMEPQDVIFVEEPENGRGQVFIYPRSVLVHHEVVNMRKHGPRRSITYCPLTGSVVGVYAEINELHTTSFGTLDMLINSNRVFYDRSTNSLWPQLLDTWIKGPLKGVPMRRFPLIWTTWRYAPKRYPKALVLGRDPYSRRGYGKDPYGSYLKDDTYYQRGGTYFPVANVDMSVQAKTRILGLTRGDNALAVVEDEVKTKGVLNGQLGLDKIVAVYDPSLDAVRMYRARADGRELCFRMEGSEMVDRETHSRWDVMGRAVSGRLRGWSLKRVESVPCMWFAWKAFHPHTLLLGHAMGDQLSNNP